MFVLFLILKILLYLLIFIISFTLLFLIVPFEYKFNTIINEEIKVNSNILFLKKFLKFTVTYENKQHLLSITVMGLRVIRKNLITPVKKIKEKDLKKKKSSFNIKDYIEKEFLNDSINYFKDIINIIKPKRIKMSGIYGFEDPSFTGITCGIIPLISNLIPSSDINLQPVFDDEIIDISGDINGRISLLIATIKTLKFIMKKNNRKRILKKSKKVETY